MKLYIPLFILTLCVAATAFATPSEEGKTIFTARCASCHNVNKVVVGPALAGVDERRNIEWIVKFVQSSQTVIKSGDKDATALFAKFNNIPMPDHPDLNADNIKNIVAYIKSQASSAAGSEKAPFAKPGKLHPAYLPLSLSNYGFFITYLSIVLLVIGALLMFVRIKEFERSKTNQP